MRVLVTRPQAEAERTAQRLTRYGYRPVIVPLTRIEPVAPCVLPDPLAYDAVAVTSANAIRFAPADLVAGLSKLPVFAVGARTADAVAAAGLAPTGIGTGDAAALGELVAGAAAHNRRVLHLCGKVHGDGLSGALVARGIECDALPTYDAVAVDPPARDLREIGRNGPIAVAMFYSPRAAELFVALLATEPTASVLRPAACLCLSPAVSAGVRGLTGVQRIVAGSPSEDALFDALLSGFPPD